MVNQVKLQNTGEDDELNTVFEDVQPEDGGYVEAPFGANSESEDAPTADEAEQERADLEAAGVNISEADDAKAKRREYKALIKDVKEYGANNGGGRTSMINLAERVTESAAKNAITGDDAGAIYDEFQKAAEKKGQLEDVGVIPEAAVSEKPVNKDSRNSQLSKLRKFITVGNKFGNDGADLVRRTRNIHLKLLEGDRDTVKKGSTYTIMELVAGANKDRSRAQGVMTDDEIHSFLWVAPKAAPEPVTGAKKVMDALVAAKSARKGGTDRDPINDPHLDAAISSLIQTLAAIDPGRLAKHDEEEAAAEAERLAEEAEKARKAEERAEKKRQAEEKKASKAA